MTNDFDKTGSEPGSTPVTAETQSALWVWAVYCQAIKSKASASIYWSFSRVLSFVKPMNSHSSWNKILMKILLDEVVSSSLRWMHCITYTSIQQQPLFYGNYTSQPALVGTASWELEDFVGAKFYCLHALASKKKLKRERYAQNKQ